MENAKIMYGWTVLLKWLKVGVTGGLLIQNAEIRYSSGFIQLKRPK